MDEHDRGASAARHERRTRQADRPARRSVTAVTLGGPVSDRGPRMRLLHPAPRPRPDVQRRVHGAQPLDRRVAPRRRPDDARRHRHAPPGRRRQHDGRRPGGGWPRRSPAAAASRVLPQDIPLDVVGSVIEYVKSLPPASTRRRSRCRPHHTIGDALGLVHKRAHGAVVVVDDGDRPARRVHRARRRRLRPLHPAARRDEPRAGDRPGRHGRPRRRSTCCRPTAARWRRSSTATAASSASSPARARCARRRTGRRSTPTAG